MVHAAATSPSPYPHNLVGRHTPHAFDNHMHDHAPGRTFSLVVGDDAYHVGQPACISLLQYAGHCSLQASFSLLYISHTMLSQTLLTHSAADSQAESFGQLDTLH